MFDWKLPLALILTVTAACSDDIAPEGDPDAAPGAPDAGFPNVVNTDEGDGVTLTEVDATSEEVWIYYDFDTRAQVQADSTTWDAAFQRFNVELNGGTSGAGMGALVPLPGQAFDAVVAVPAEGFVQDSETGLAIDADGVGWYVYDVSTHKLSPQDQTYVFRTAEGGHVKLRFVGYYDAAGGSGHPSFRWKALP